MCCKSSFKYLIVENVVENITKSSETELEVGTKIENHSGIRGSSNSSISQSIEKKV